MDQDQLLLPANLCGVTVSARALRRLNFALTVCIVLLLVQFLVVLLSVGPDAFDVPWQPAHPPQHPHQPLQQQQGLQRRHSRVTNAAAASSSGGHTGGADGPADAATLLPRLRGPTQGHTPGTRFPTTTRTTAATIATSTRSTPTTATTPAPRSTDSEPLESVGGGGDAAAAAAVAAIVTAAPKASPRPTASTATATEDPSADAESPTYHYVRYSAEEGPTAAIAVAAAAAASAKTAKAPARGPTAATAVATGVAAGGVPLDAILRSWTKETRSVMESYLSTPDATAPPRCGPHLCPAGLANAAARLQCCAAADASSPFVVVVRTDLVASNPWYRPGRRLHLNVNKEGQLGLWSQRTYFETTLTCEALNQFQPTDKPDKRCQRSPTDMDEQVARALPYFVAYRAAPGSNGAPVCVSKDGRVGQRGPGGRVLGDELGRPCGLMSAAEAPPLDAGAAAAQPQAVVDRVVVLTQPWAKAHFHWITESFVRLGAAWDLVVGDPVHTKVHVPSRSSRVVAQLLSVGVREDQIVSDAVCAAEVIVPMVGNCGQAVSPLAMYMRQITWLHMAAPPGSGADPWSVAPPVPSTPRELVVIVRRTGTRALVDPDAFLSWVTAIVAPVFDVVEFRDDPVPSLPETLGMFRDAAVVIGVHGAGLANIYACRPPTMVIELLFRTKLNLCFRGLAQALGLDYHGFVPAALPDGDRLPLSPDDLAIVERLLRQRMADAQPIVRADPAVAAAMAVAQADPAAAVTQADPAATTAAARPQKTEAARPAAVSSTGQTAAWTADDVSAWLRQLDLNDADAVVAALHTEGIRGVHLQKLSHDLLGSFHVRAGDRLTILEARDRLLAPGG